ncbi:MAG: ATP-binding cassette domain-containing protein [bacterium]|nr:ATP-binding cassette domain-containing protein [bacterium]MDE0289043.1 ATP-binding cassette domain-containing protein [bacterium]MDE0436997.1 ATP-binding cassette domain-containing protein [bacterium]
MAEVPRLEVRDLVKHFPVRRGTFAKAREYVKAVNGVSLEIRDGETVAIVGESGCGKSTIARLILRLERPTSGSIRLDGEDLLAMEDTTSARRAVQLVSQNPWSALNRRKTIKHTLTQPLKVHDLVDTRAGRTVRAAQLLEEVGLSPDYLYRFPSGISGGELQRVTIARALAVSPGVLILDEPTASLDVSVKASIINLLIDLRDLENLTYLFITHEIDIAKHVSDRIAVMYLGRIVEQGPTEEIFENPQHPYTQSLLGSVPVPDPQLRAELKPISGEVPSAIDLPSGCTFHTRCPYVFDRCPEEIPELSMIDSRHLAACHLMEQGR